MRTVIIAVAALIAADALAVEARFVQSWNSKLTTTSQLLKAQKYAEALPILNGVSSEMLRILGPSEATTYVLSIPLIQTAVAEAGLGDQRAALWHWHMAQTLYPKSAESDLSMFGAPGAFLKEHLLANPRLEKCDHLEGIQLPRVLKTAEPIYPEGARKFRERGIVIIDLRVDANGVPSEPRIVKPLSTPLDYAALDALRKWIFTPAEAAGAPIASSFCITINFKLN